MYSASQNRRSQTPVSQIIDDYASITSADEPGQARSAPHSYQLPDNILQPGGSLITIRRNLSTRETAQERRAVAPVSTSAPTAGKGARRTVLARTSDGHIVRVQRPVRDSELFMRHESRTSDRGQTSRSESVMSASIYGDDTSRDTITSTMTLVETALAEQRTYQRSRGIQVPGHSASTGTKNCETLAGARGRTSGNIEIGHIDEKEEHHHDMHDRSRKYSASNYGDAGFHRAELDRFTTPRSRSAHESYNTSDARAAFWDYVPAAGNVAMPSPLPAVLRYSGDSSASTRYTDKSTEQQARDVPHVGTWAEGAATSPWLQQLARPCSHVLASCSIVLPVAFVALGVAVILARGKPVSSSWSRVADLVEIAAAVWPILVFATTAAQCFKAGIIFRRNTGTTTGRMSGFAGRNSTLPRRLEPLSLCLVVFFFLIWCLSPIGPLAARRMYGTTQEAVQGQHDVFYVENAGQNQVWDPKSTTTLSPTSRSELIQTIAAKYIRSLSQDNVNNNNLTPLNEPISTYSPTETPFIESIVPASGSIGYAALPRGIRARNEVVSNTHQGVSSVIAAEFDALNFSMTASAFDFKCGDWTLMTRVLGGNDTTSPGQVSYSASQTLGLSMAGHDGSSPAASPPAIRFVSLNSRSVINPAVLRRRRRDNATLAVDRWEYSSISCSYEQVFYDVPMQCSRDRSTGLNKCAQSAAATLVPSDDDSLNTPLGDFALDFVWSGNLPTTDKTATATERYIQRGGPSGMNPAIISTRDVGNSMFNLSASVSPDEFAQRFGHLFSTWVGLGYCPQCSAGIVVNSSSVPAGLRPRYRKASSAVTWSGEQVFTVNWAWMAVFMVFTSVLLFAAVAAVVVESMVAAKAARGDTTARRTVSKSDIIPLRLPTMYSTFSNNGQRSPQWGDAVMQDVNAATGSESGYSWRIYG